MKRLALILALALSLGVALPGVAHADINDFTITNFTADYYLSKADPQGQLSIQEHLMVDFTDYNHGILRALPQKYNGQQQHIRIAKVQRDGSTEPYSTYTSNGNEVLKIGDADQTVTGKHAYEIDYTVQNVIRFSSEGSNPDELIWNTNGTEWTQPFLAETTTLHIGTDINAPLGSLGCFTGVQGSHAQDCTVDGQGKTVVFKATRALSSGETMTFTADFPRGIFRKPTAADWWHDNRANVLALALPGLIAFAIGYWKWHKDGKDIKGRGTIIPEYGPPSGLRAAEADVIDHYKLGTNAISATIIDLAIRKYLKIIESDKKSLLGGKHKSYTFQRLPAPTNDSLKPYEQQIYDGLFRGGDTTQIADLKNNFYVTKDAVQKELPRLLTTNGYFPKNPRWAGSSLHLIGIVLFIGGFVLAGTNWYWRIGFALAGAVFLLFGTIMPRRTQKGVDAKDALDGLKLYMNTAEKDRIAMLQSVDAPYAEKSAEPQKTVELFEKLLPYAMVLGVEKSWAKQFEGIYTTPPDWYAGNWAAFNAGYLVGSLSDSMSAMNASFASPSSSGSGGGGGFSGGGGGGGGGGGW